MGRKGKVKEEKGKLMVILLILMLMVMGIEMRKVKIIKRVIK